MAGQVYGGGWESGFMWDNHISSLTFSLPTHGMKITATYVQKRSDTWVQIPALPYTSCGLCHLTSSLWASVFSFVKQESSQHLPRMVAWDLFTKCPEQCFRKWKRREFFPIHSPCLFYFFKFLRRGLTS
jgi:hypothetical protein